MPTLSIKIDAGRHDRHDCLIDFPLGHGLSAGIWDMVAEDGGRTTLQAETDGRACCIAPLLHAGQIREFTLEPRQAEAGGVTITQANGALEIKVGADTITRYVHEDVPARPYFYPVFAPGQIPVTRAYPMVPDADGETRDHPHHRSLWIAFGEVNGADNWSEAAGHASTKHLQFQRISGGPVCGSFAATSLWVRPEGAPLLTERLQVRAWAVNDDVRVLDFDIGLEATHGAVHFGDTKEGGVLSIRVASEMDVPRTGRISNVFGGIDEAETWGMASHWCDYSGLVAGAPAGIALYDHPLSFRYPTHWHVRNYGLMTANPFAYAAYTDGAKDGSHVLSSGETLRFKYRLILHKGSCDDARVAARYVDYVAPPRVTVIPG